jgi:hypothetical protein
MSLLFDISPEEPEKSKKPRRAKKQEPSPQPAQPVSYEPETILGQSDGHYTCHNPKCQATYFDILDDYRSQWRIACAFCGWQQHVPAVEGVLAPSDDFVFFEGICSGMTLAQASRTENGEAYIRWCAAKHKSDAVREACQKWISSLGYSATHRSEPCSS